VTLTVVPASPGTTVSSPDQSGNSVLEQIISWFRNLLGA
jgi:hypothetical protein